MQSNTRNKIVAGLITIVVVISIFVPLAIQNHWYPFNTLDYPIDGKLDSSFIKNMTENFSRIIFTEYDESKGEIAKGRFFGTKGEILAAELIKENLSKFGLKVTIQQIKNIDYPFKFLDFFLNLTTKLEVTEQKLAVFNKTNGRTEIIDDFYINPTWDQSFLDIFYDENKLTRTFNETNLSVLRYPPDPSFIGPWDTYWFDNFLLNESVHDSIIENFTNYITKKDVKGFALWLYSIFEQHYNLSKELVIQTQSSYLLIEEDRHFNPNPKPPAWEPNYIIEGDLLVKLVGDDSLIKMIHGFSKILQLEIWSKNNQNCKGILRYDFNNDTYDMNLHRYFAIPIIYITGELGKEINRSVDSFKINYTLGQRYNDSVISYNVIGTIEGVDKSKTVIVSCLYDSWWNQGTADSAIGMSIVMAIAKYFINLEKQNIRPQYTTKFIAFSGEEYGRVGARYYDEKNRSETIEAIIDVNQVGFDNPNEFRSQDLELEIWTNQPNRYGLKNFVSEIVYRTNYKLRTGINFTINSNIQGGPVGNKDPFALNRLFNNIKTVYFVKNGEWVYHHRDGLNHTEGDVFKYYNETDVEVTSEMILNVTVGLNPLVFTGMEDYVPLTITTIMITLILIVIWRKKYFKQLLKNYDKT